MCIFLVDRELTRKCDVYKYKGLCLDHLVVPELNIARVGACLTNYQFSKREDTLPRLEGVAAGNSYRNKSNIFSK